MLIVAKSESRVLRSPHGDLRVSEAAYYIAFGLFCFSRVLAQTNMGVAFPGSLDFISKSLMVMAGGFLCLKLVSQVSGKSKAITVFLIPLVALACILSTRASGDMELLWIALFVIAAKDISIIRLAKISLIVQLLVMVLTVSASFFDVVPSYYIANQNRAFRSSLGYAHPNIFGSCLVNICLSIIIIEYRKGFTVPIAAIIAALVINQFTASSSTAQISLIIIGILFIICRLFANEGKRLATLTLICFVSAVVISIGFMVFYTPANPTHVAINEMMHWRFSLGHQCFLYSPPSLFGNDYAYAPVQSYTLGTGTPITFFVDNSFMRLILKFGYMGSALLLIPVVAVLMRARKNNEFNEALFGILVFSIIGVSESFFLDFQSNYFLIAVATILYSKPLSSLILTRTTSLGNSCKKVGAI